MSEKLSKQFKQGVFLFATGEDVPFGAEYLKSETLTNEAGTASVSVHFFLCFAKENEEGLLVPVDAPQQAKPQDENSFLV